MCTAAAVVAALYILRWRDVQEREDVGQVTEYGKGGMTRHVLLSSGTWDALTAIRDEAGGDAPVFASRTGGPLSRTQTFRIVRAAAKRAGVDKDVSPHWLRHAHASHALDRGAAYISCKPPWGTAASRQRGGICMRGRRRAVQSILWYSPRNSGYGATADG